MRTTILSILVLFIIFGCTETVTSTYKLSNQNFTKAVQDSIIIEILNTSSTLELKGNMSLMEGQCEIILYDPHVDTLADRSTERRIIYDQVYIAPQQITIDEQFDPSKGKYILYYSVKNYNDVAPDGNLRLELINQY